MGLLKPEYSGGAQAVRAENAKVGGVYGNQADAAACFPGATGYSAFANSSSAQFFDAAVSNHVEDIEIDSTIRKQEEEVYQATMRLSVLENRHEMARAKSDKGANGEPLVKRIGKSIGTLPPGPTQPPTRLPFEKILKLLLASLKGSFAANIPRQKCASPVPYNSSTTGYHPAFYVSKERKLLKNDEGFEGIPVRYQGFTKSTVWFSKENPRWGIVARRMQHQSRMKQKQKENVEQNIASKAALFFYVFEGFSYVLIERSDPNVEVNKSNLSSYVVENAAKFVQVWPIFKNPNKTQTKSAVPANALSTATSTAKLLTVAAAATMNAPKNRSRSKSKSSAKSAPATNNKLDAARNAAKCSNAAAATKKKPRSASSTMSSSSSASAQLDTSLIRMRLNRSQSTSSKKRSFDDVSDTDVFRESKRQHSSDDLFQLAFAAPAPAATIEPVASVLDSFDFLVNAGASDDMSVHSAQHSQHSQQSHHSHHSQSSALHIPRHGLLHQHAARRLSQHLRHGLPTVDLGFDSLLEEALLSGEEDYESRGSDETTLQDMFIEESDDGFGGSHDPFGVVLADQIFKTFCDSMQTNEFAREYERIQSLLFNKNFSQSLRVAIQNKDPRITKEFMYPEFGVTQFVERVSVGMVRMVERTVGSSEFVVESCDDKAKEILRMDPVGTPNIFESLDKSDMGYIMAKYYWLQSKPSSFWFQRVITLPDNQPAVIRGYSSIDGSAATGKQTWTIRFQNLSYLFSDVLALPSADTL